MSENNVTELHAQEPKKLTNEERLEIENVYLQVENLRLQGERMQADLVRSVQMRQALQARMLELQTMLGVKYKVDMTKVQINPDGTILPAPGK
jgi:hypothetical protein